MRFITRAAAATVAGLIITAGTAVVASAANTASQSGNNTVGCAVDWEAESVYSSDASLYPAGLLTDRTTGAPVNGGALGGNGGYVTEVRPEYGDAGIFEINRFLTGSGPSLTLHVRIPLSTDAALEQATLAVTLPDTGSTWTTAVASPALPRMSLWGNPYSTYTWSQVSGASVSAPDNNHVTIDYPALAVKSGTVVEFTAPVTDAFLATLSDYQAALTATTTDKSGCTVRLPAVPQEQVDGDDNDTTTEPKGTTSSTGWTDNHQTFTVTAPRGYYYVVDGDYASVVDVTVVDNGRFPRKTETVPVYETRTTTTPVYTSTTTCTDPTVGIFQVDSYKPRTPAMVRTIKANSQRNLLPYRFDGPYAARLATVMNTPGTTYASLWGRSTTEFVTIKLSDVSKAGSLKAAINAKTRTAPALGGRMAVGGTWTTAWKLARGATPAAPWTSSPDTSKAKAQVEFDAVTLPKKTCTTKRVQTGTTTTTSTVQVGTREVTTVLDPEPVTDPVYAISTR